MNAPQYFFLAFVALEVWKHSAQYANSRIKFRTLVSRLLDLTLLLVIVYSGGFFSGGAA